MAGIILLFSICCIYKCNLYAVVFRHKPHYQRAKKKHDKLKNSNGPMENATMPRISLHSEISSESIETAVKDEIPITFESPFWDRLHDIITLQGKEYSPTSVNTLRVIEVVGLAFLTGALFYDVGNDTTATGFGRVNSLLFFSVTLWTFTRMYTAVGSDFIWYNNLKQKVSERSHSLGPVCFGRIFVVVASKSWWPFIYVIVSFPLAGIIGDWKDVMTIAMFLCLSNICYISIGSCLGVLFPSIPYNMIISILISQTSLVAAGFYTTLPIYLSGIRYISPVFWTFSGIVKMSYTWSDT